MDNHLHFTIADFAKKLEDQKAEAERQLKVFIRQMKVRVVILQNMCLGFSPLVEHLECHET